jgi:catechol 2,3-dioxygenase-like lactoylglutathione lyase family enzyme
MLKNNLFFLVIIVFLTGNAWAGNPAAIELQRATLTVSDPERSLTFYRDLLGFTVSADAEYATPSLRRMFNVPEGVTPRLVLLDASPDQPRALALVSAPGLAVDAEANRRNAPALVLNTLAMDETHARMLAAGVEVIVPPTPLNDFSGKPFGREALYLDPDGVRVVLFEYGASVDD